MTEGTSTGGWRVVTTAQAAKMLAVTPDFVRDHQVELGAYRLPSRGPRAALRFDPEFIRQVVEARRVGAATPQPPTPRRPGPRRGSRRGEHELLPLPDGAK
jgi:hypothetical protein